MNVSFFHPTALVGTFDYLHPLPEEMTPRQRQADHERKLKFQRALNRNLKKVPIYCLK